MSLYGATVRSTHAVLACCMHRNGPETFPKTRMWPIPVHQEIDYLVALHCLPSFSTLCCMPWRAEPSWDTSVAFSYARVFHEPGTYYYAGGKYGNTNMGQVNVVKEDATESSLFSLAGAPLMHAPRGEHSTVLLYCAVQYSAAHCSTGL